MKLGSWTRRLVGASAIALVAGVFAPALATAGSPPAWWSYTRAPAYEAIAEGVMVPTRDGTKLACTVRRPGEEGEPIAEPVPAIVSQYWAYSFISHFLTEEPIYFAERGYANVVCNIRGTGASEGTYDGILTEVEALDNYDLIEWIADQPWSDGRVGQAGVSYGGMTTLRVAALQPPHLEAIAPQYAADSLYTNFFYPGGIHSTNAEQMAPLLNFLTEGRSDPVAQLQTWQEHPNQDSYWDQVDVYTKWSDIKGIPTLLQGGWYDYFRRGDVRNFRALRSSAWLVNGPWFHNGGLDWSTDSVPSNNLPRGAFLAFFDRWLMELPGAPHPSSRVAAFELPESGGEGWKKFATFPPADVEPHPMHLTTDGRVASAPGSHGTREYVVDPADGPSALCFPEPGPGEPSPCDPFQDEQPQDALRLTFTTKPLAADKVVAGEPVLVLKAALSAANGNFAARISDVSPDGSVREASVGYLRASHRLSLRSESLPVPNQQYRYRIRLEPLFYRFQEGHRLRISISSGDQPRIDPSAEAGTVTVATGLHGSKVVLPVRGK